MAEQIEHEDWKTTVGPKMWHVLETLEYWSEWWRIERESTNLYRLIAATREEGPNADSIRPVVYEGEDLEAVLDQVLEWGLPWQEADDENG